MKTLLFVFGTRPEAIKVAPLILKLKKSPKHRVLVCSTGQHREMLKPLLQFFNIVPDFDLDLMRPGQTLTSLSTLLMTGLQKIIDDQKQTHPIDQIIVQGDTTSSCMGGIVAFYNKIEVIHLEAGLRSNDIYSPFPEEFNRKTLSLIANMHLAPTEEAKQNLLREGIDPAKIFVTGNTGIDALFEVKNQIQNSSELTKNFETKFNFIDPNKKLILVTLHRRESFEKNIKIVMNGILSLAERKDIQFIAPLHLNPVVRQTASEIFAQCPANIHLTDPIDYIPFVYLMTRSHFIITDSGGIQEEAPSLGKPVLIARENTERPEAITAGTSKLVPLEKNSFISSVNELLDNEQIYQTMAKAKNPFGDGSACDRIASLI
ncbi:non-hydrolyzing UDP-N-acetylglucosamine 2-epimerase [Pseudobdellovibrio sp. HCB154]|uniref:non-hydrolyzing UDP-N-acetylglucosamine 2-epimerase n=1 Tax=Pseudobdellovibrio sp. HCB154 TaxID=3386277 RepID=UPI003917344B